MSKHNRVFSLFYRCGPFQPALQILQDARMRRLVNSMVTAVLPLSRGLEAIKLAQSKGTLKVQLIMASEASNHDLHGAV